MTAANWPPFFAPQTLAKLQGLQLRARRIVEGYVAGVHRSPLRGHSIEFAEHREYAAGDDPDWTGVGEAHLVARRALSTPVDREGTE